MSGAPRSVPERIRAFNRFYTEQIGALDDRHDGLAVTLAESRTLLTIDRLGEPDIGQIAARLQLDLGYVSRLVSRLQRAKLVERRRAEDDGRRRLVVLTSGGTAALRELEHRSNRRMASLTQHLTPGERDDLLAAMATIRDLLERKAR